MEVHGPFGSKLESKVHSTDPIQKLRDNQPILQSILDNVVDGVVVADMDGKFLFFNASAIRISGFGAIDAPISAWSESYGLFLADEVTPYPPENLPLARAINGQTVSDELVFVKNPKLEKGVWVSVNASPWRDAAGKQLGGIATFRDVTKLRKASQRVSQLSKVVEQTADSVMITNKDGAILYINPAFEHTTGYSMDDVTGKTPRILRSGKQDSKFYEVMWATLLSGDAFRGTLINRKKSGELYHAEQTITPMCDDQGNLTHFVSVIKDLTERMASFEAAAELQVARRVQQRLYPREIPKIAGVEIAGAAQASLLMCGDYFDYFLVEDNKLGLVVGDVSGHGLGQALIMAETRAWLHSYIQTWDDPCEVLRRLNTPLIKDLSSSQFVTMCLAVVDVANRTLTYANAGHPSGYLFDKSGNPKLVLESSGIPLGVLPEVRGLTDRSVAIEPGDLILLITDGFLESPRPDGEFIKVEELFHVIREHHDAPAQEILDGLFEHLRFFMKGETQTDDITAVICRITDL